MIFDHGATTIKLSRSAGSFQTPTGGTRKLPHAGLNVVSSGRNEAA